MPKVDQFRKKLKNAWHNFIETGFIDESIVRREIAESWKRCRDYGLNPYALPQTALPALEGQEKKERLSEAELMIRISRPLIEILHHQVEFPEIAIFVMDDQGVILDAVGTGRLWETCKQANGSQSDLVGILINEKECGTFASMITKITGKPSQVLAEEHYFCAFHDGITSAALIYGEGRRLKGIISVAEFYEGRHPRSLGMVIAAAKAIENHLHLLGESEKVILSNRYLQIVMDQIGKGLITIDNHGKILHQNPLLNTIFDFKEKGIVGSFVDEVFQYPSILKLFDSDQEHFLKEVILDGKKEPRHLVTIQNITSSRGEIIGKFMLIEEAKKINKYVHKIIGATARYNFSDILGNSPSMKAVRDQGILASRGVSNVLVLGESGTGKEMVAQSIHSASRHAEGPFVALNCAAIPIDLIESELFGYEEGSFTGASKKGRPGKFELADEGTLFFDEVDKMPIEMQVKLLRVIEERKILRLGGNQYIPVDVRIIAASNASLADLIRRGLFREDLFYRLNVLQIQIPPLRERIEDIPILVDFLIREKSQRIGKTVIGIEEDARHYLCVQKWPGNVRELGNRIERAVHLAQHEMVTFQDIASPDDMIQVPSGIPEDSIKVRKASPQQVRILDEVEKEVISNAIMAAEGNLSLASRLLKVTRPFLYRKIKKHKIRYATKCIEMQ